MNKTPFSSKKTITPFLCSLLLLLLSSSLLNAGRVKTVIIDPGHGGHDAGAHYRRVYEKHLALDTAKRIEKILRKNGIRTIMTRRGDYFVSLNDRAKIGNRYRGAIFVSIHYNHARNKKAQGFETFYYSSRGRQLAARIQANLSYKIRKPNRGVKFARFRVIKKSKHPSALVECGFISNRSDRRYVVKGRNREKIAKNIARGILRYVYDRKRGRLR